VSEDYWELVKMRVSEETVSTVLADMIFEKLSEWFEKLLLRAFTKCSGRRAESELEYALGQRWVT